MGNRRPCFNPGLRRSCLVALAFASSVFAIQQPYLPAKTAQPLVRRQGCIANFFSCADQGVAFSGVCCQNGQRCALDANNNPACCPGNAVCTGAAPASFVAPSPQTTAVSYVPNVYFSFPYVATYFADPAACSQAVSQCSANFAACTTQLGGQVGGNFGVTIIVPGGSGTTITGNAGVSVPTASATSICSSLSVAACSNLQPSMCTMTGTVAGGFYFGTGNAAARPTPAPGLAQYVAAGMVGVAGLGFADML